MSGFLDCVDVAMVKANNAITNADRPIWAKPLAHVKDVDQPHIGYEVCRDHGSYFDAGEFTDYKSHTLWE